jgi:hypothetical protein
LPIALEEIGKELRDIYNSLPESEREEWVQKLQEKIKD